MIKDRNIDLNAQINPAKIQGGAGMGGLFFLSGAPRPGADIAGRIYYVNKNGGSDENDGLSPDSPYATIEKARAVAMARIVWTGAPWANNDMVVIYPGVYAEAITGGLFGASLIGLGWAYDLDGEAGVTLKPADGSPWDCTSIINAKIMNLCLHAPTDAGTEVLLQADNLNRALIQDCVFAGVAGASPTTVKGLEVVKDMTGSVVKRCIFQVCRTGLYLVADNANSKQITGDLFEDLEIIGGDTAGMYFDINCTPSLTRINRCNIAGNGATLALGLDDNTVADAVHVYNTNIEATANDGGTWNNCYLNGALLT